MILAYNYNSMDQKSLFQKAENMEQQLSALERLTQKIDGLLVRLKNLEQENSELRNELVAVKAQNEAKDAQIARLNDELALKDAEIDEVIAKIETILGD